MSKESGIMSATGRSNVRIDQDNYTTPDYTINSLFDNHEFPKGSVFLEPCVGTGNILRKALSYLPYSTYFAIDINKENIDLCSQISTEKKVVLKCTDFLKLSLKGQPDLIVTNPPFSLAQEFLVKCFEVIAPHGQVIFLLRLAFLESGKRKALINSLPLKQLLVLEHRPRFVNNRTDATAYAWFCVEKNYKGFTEIKVV
jgi:ubiquinone/menaquinone biosynthesis C-methylase UbiE